MIFRDAPRILQYFPSATSAPLRETSYQYDAGDQLTGADYPTLPDETFTYDPMGNRLSVSSVSSVVEYNVNNLNQYTNITKLPSAGGVGGGLPLSYDLNGNQLTLYAFNDDGSITTNHLEWNLENRLSQISNFQSRISYYYDPFGRRLKKTVFGGASSNVTYYLYSDEGLVAEFDAAGTETRSYGYTPGSLWMNDPLYMRDASGACHYALNDHLGAVQKLVNRNGAPVWSMTAESFGKASIDPATTITNNLRFSSQLYDSESGLHYNTFRYYDPVVGRYTRRDPLIDESFFRWLPGEGRLRREKGRLRSRSKQPAYPFAANGPITSYDLLGLDNPGCDLPPKLNPSLGSNDTANCYLQCCAKHDACYFHEKCTAASWGANIAGIAADIAGCKFCSIFINLISPCAKCNSTVVACFAGCCTGISKPGGSRWFCPNGPGAGKWFDDWYKIPEDCWEDGKKPEQPPWAL